MDIIKDFRMAKTGENAVIRVLEAADLPRVLELQEATRGALPPAQKMFVLPQSPDYFAGLLERDGGAMVGIESGGDLIAQMVVMGAMTVDEMTARQKLTRNEVFFHHATPNDSVVIAKSMAVHPGYRGNELSQHMLEAAQALPLSRQADHMFAQISVDNIRSWDLFLREGFGIVAAAVDPADLKPRFIVQKPALGYALHHMQATHDVDPVADFASIMRLTQREALIGMLDQGEAFKLAFYSSVDMAAAWDDSADLAAQ